MFEFSSQTLVQLMVVSGAVFAIAVFFGATRLYKSEALGREANQILEDYPAMSELDAAKAQLTHKQSDLSEVERRLSDLRTEEAEIQRNSVDAQHWQTQVEQAKREYDSLDEKLKRIDEVRDSHDEAAKDLAARRSELDELVRRREALGDEIGDIEVRREEAEKLNLEIDEQARHLAELVDEMSKQEDVRDEVAKARFELDQIARRKADLEQELEVLPGQVDDLASRKETLREEISDLADKQNELGNIVDEIARLNAREQALEESIEQLEAKRNSLFGDVEGIHIKGADKDGGLTEEQAREAVKDLWQKPSCLFDKGIAILKSPLKIDSEQQAIENVVSYLDGHKLLFDDSLIKQFHTSLKIGQISPLTVLAGISGTGKSLLPQRYAEAMGIPFLKVAVQPRWDSPQDLLGFYNYLESRYKATDFSRALAYVDTESINSAFIDGAMDDRLLMVLLDEMNLSRIEYYFSEFLSRLENRPAPGNSNEDALRNCRIEIDVPIADGERISIYPGHNTLFVGTMNEDESTQALSNKVLDRGNAIRFKKPTKFVTKKESGLPDPAQSYLEFEEWHSWYRTDLPDNKADTLDENVSALNEQLGRLGQPFGFRVYQAIYAYAANHPDVGEVGSEDRALVEMMRMRVLPKLRGIELQTAEDRAVNEIANLVENKLENEELAKEIRGSKGEDGMFTWTG